MKLGLLLLAALLLPVSALADGMAPDRLLIEQCGPSDATLRPFEIAVGPMEKSSRDIVYVSPDVFVTVVAAAKRADSGGTFCVSELGEGGPIVHRLDHAGLADLVGPLVVMFTDSGLGAPGFLAAIATN